MRRYGVIVFPGTNCDRDILYCCEKVLRQDCIKIWHESEEAKDMLEECEMLILPGGFSYGDYLRAGALARVSPIVKEIVRFANSGKLILGICNGFQILLEIGLLPGVLFPNVAKTFVSKWVHVKISGNTSPFTSHMRSKRMLFLPVAHKEGRYFVSDSVLKGMEDNGQVLLRYCDEFGNVSKDVNFNGSKGNIAGICNVTRNVFGLMPHPERAMEKILGSDDGLTIFYSMEEYCSMNSLGESF